MIPLNRPGYKYVNSDHGFLENHFPGLHPLFLSNAGDALNLTYADLHKRLGRLRVGVCPLACTLALDPIVKNGHVPVFLDVDPETFNLNSSLLESKVQDIDALEVIHLGGNPNEMSVISSWADRHDKIVIEDCAQALGSTYDGQDLGTFGDFACFSLMKNLYAPVGGLLVSKQAMDKGDLPDVSNVLVLYRKFKKILESKADHRRLNPWNWAYSAFLHAKENKASSPDSAPSGINAKTEERLMKQFASVSYLTRLRREQARFMIDRIDPLRFTVQKEPSKGRSNWNRLLIRAKDTDALDLIRFLRQRGIAANNLTQNYLKCYQPHISQDKLLGEFYSASEMKNYDEVFPSLLAIPCSPYLKEDEMVYIVDSLHAFFL